MPKATKREESNYRLPEGEIFTGKLVSVDEREVTFHQKDRKTKEPLYNPDGTNKMGSFTRWEWVFIITDGEFKDVNAYGDTGSEYNTRSDNLVRQWSEALRGSELPIGAELDTDELIDLPCMFTIRHEEPRPQKDGTMFYGCAVADVYPLSGALLDASALQPAGVQEAYDPWAAGQDDSPPF